jgi:hypothetical protein
MRRFSVVKITIYVAIVLSIIFVGLFMLYLNDSEFQLTEKLEEEMGLILPDKYSVVEGKGSIFYSPIEYKFIFADNDFIELESKIKGTTFYNDTTSLRQLLETNWDPDDPRKVWEMKGIWLETDTSYFYFPIKSEINEAILDKRKKTFHATMTP